MSGRRGSDLARRDSLYPVAVFAARVPACGTRAAGRRKQRASSRWNGFRGQANDPVSTLNHRMHIRRWWIDATPVTKTDSSTTSGKGGLV